MKIGTIACHLCVAVLVNDEGVLIRDARATSEGARCGVKCKTSPLLFHEILPVPVCCDKEMEGSNLALHVLGYKCPKCQREIMASVKFEEGWLEPDLAGIDSTP